ncbi:MAG: hypothetical protein FJ147_19695 [Deltaproteobacteria bacterium]|nr:hypothetical protein [Deltaproteobacteria bacterium]
MARWLSTTFDPLLPASPSLVVALVQLDHLPLNATATEPLCLFQRFVPVAGKESQAYVPIPKKLHTLQKSSDQTKAWWVRSALIGSPKLEAQNRRGIANSQGYSPDVRPRNEAALLPNVRDAVNVDGDDRPLVSPGMNNSGQEGKNERHAKDYGNSANELGEEMATDQACERPEDNPAHHPNEETRGRDDRNGRVVEL